MRISDWSSDVCSSDLQGAVARLVVEADFSGYVGRRISVGHRREQIVASARRAQKGCGLVEDLALFGIAQPADQRQLWRDRPFAVHESRIGVGALAIVVSDGVEPRQAKERKQVARVNYYWSLHIVHCIKGTAEQIGDAGSSTGREEGEVNGW